MDTLCGCFINRISDFFKNILGNLHDLNESSGELANMADCATLAFPCFFFAMKN